MVAHLLSILVRSVVAKFYDSEVVLTTGMMKVSCVMCVCVCVFFVIIHLNVPTSGYLLYFLICVSSTVNAWIIECLKVAVSD